MKIQMSRIMPAILFLMLFAAGTGSSLAEEGGTYYTNMNIWYEKPQKIYSTNYHKGSILPIGTEVELIKANRKELRFREAGTDMEFHIKLVKKYTDLNEEEFLSRYLSSDNILKSGKYKNLSDMEKKNIEEGTLEKGMTKDAVLMAYGYPPTHRTPSLESGTWTYWTSRLISFNIYFKDGIVNKVLD